MKRKLIENETHQYYITCKNFYLLRRSLRPSRPAGRSGKVKVLIIEATHRASVRPVVTVHIGTAAIEVQESGERAIYRARPVVAVRTNIEERTIDDVAVARHRQFQW